jgi:hypothetical protein
MQIIVTNCTWNYGINNQNPIKLWEDWWYHIDIMGVVWRKDIVLTIIL